MSLFQCHGTILIGATKGLCNSNFYLQNKKKIFRKKKSSLKWIQLNSFFFTCNQPPLPQDQCDAEPTTKGFSWKIIDFNFENKRLFWKKSNANDFNLDIIYDYYHYERHSLSVVPSGTKWFWKFSNISLSVWLEKSPAENHRLKLLPIDSMNHKPNTNRRPSCTLNCPECNTEWSNGKWWHWTLFQKKLFEWIE